MKTDKSFKKTRNIGQVIKYTNIAKSITKTKIILKMNRIKQ